MSSHHETLDPLVAAELAELDELAELADGNLRVLRLHRGADVGGR